MGIIPSSHDLQPRFPSSHVVSWVFTEAMIDPRTCAINQDQTEKEEKEVKNVFLQHTQATSSILVRKCVY